tara:strand:- start:307 stop:615 length:309 start_codon:yes stop_codon:yes gene_type:complete
MTYAQIKKLADQFGMIVEDDLEWFPSGVWEAVIELKEGFGFECQYHSTQAIISDPDHSMKKSDVWADVAETMKHEAELVQPCDCGYWTDGRSIEFSRRDKND